MKKKAKELQALKVAAAKGRGGTKSSLQGFGSGGFGGNTREVVPVISDTTTINEPPSSKPSYPTRSVLSLVM